MQRMYVSGASSTDGECGGGHSSTPERNLMESRGGWEKEKETKGQTDTTDTTDRNKKRQGQRDTRCYNNINNIV